MWGEQEEPKHTKLMSHSLLNIPIPSCCDTLLLVQCYCACHNDPLMYETRLSKFFCPKMKLLKFEHLFWINRRHQISSFNMAHLAYEHKQLKL